jgi:hypothetical protein
MDGPHHHPHHGLHARRGGTTGGVVALLLALGTLAVTALVVRPQFLIATPQSTLPQEQPALVESHQAVLEAIVEMLGRSEAVLAVHPRDASPYYDVVIWTHDAQHTGRVDRDEIAMLSHSKVLWTLTLHQLAAPAESSAPSAHPAHADQSRMEGDTFWRPTAAARPEICEIIRNSIDTQSRVVETGLSDVAFEPVTFQSDQRVLMRVTLTWATDSADGKDRASALVSVIMRQSQAEE